jgi:hypothetical protein
VSITFTLVINLSAPLPEMLSLSSAQELRHEPCFARLPLEKANIRMRCRAQKLLDANVIQLPRDLLQESGCALSMNLSAAGRFNRLSTRLGELAQPIS